MKQSRFQDPSQPQSNVKEFWHGRVSWKPDGDTHPTVALSPNLPTVEALRLWCQEQRTRHQGKPFFQLEAFKRVIEPGSVEDIPLGTKEEPASPDGIQKLREIAASLHKPIPADEW